ncbi:MAG TPA: hypothetical protein VH599_02885 [Ktedonobacterales bacterium]|jgi:hypothetical protein
MAKTNDETKQSALHSSEARELEAKIEELQKRIALLESVVHEVALQQPIPAERTERLFRHLDEWLADESGYDEETWPKVKAALEEDRLSSRSLFTDE